jgi:PGF-pre-PGF domain-containing protein
MAAPLGNAKQTSWRWTGVAPVVCLSILFMFFIVAAPADAADRFNNNARWSSFNLATVNSTLKGFNGAVFDGRYVYFSPYYNGATYSGSTVRYDTTQPFSSVSSYEYFNITRINRTLKSFGQPATLGNYVYYSPWYDGVAFHGNSVRYDRTKSFTDPASWEYFNITRVNRTLAGFWGALAAGDYIYYIPSSNNVHSSGESVRYHTLMSYTDPASWEYFNLTTLNGGLGGFYGGVTYGNYVYYIPNSNDAGMTGVSARHDITKAFNDPTAWEYLDLTTVNPSLVGFWGTGAGSGNYIYYCPYTLDYTTSNGVAVRYDITKTFTNTGSWETFDIATVDPHLVGFAGVAEINGKIYYAPTYNDVGFSGLAARYDSAQPFSSTAAWEKYDLTSMGPLLKGFYGNTAGGDSVYYVPFGGTYNGVVGRYNATPAPVASFTAFPTSGPPPLAVIFTDNSSESPTSWNWSFGDGTISALQNPGHTYTFAGTYSINLTVTRIGENDSLVRTDYITVSPAPSANFTASPVSGTAPLAVQFTDASTGTITSYSWDFGDGATSAQQDPSHTYATAGTFSVNLTVTGPGGSDSEVKASCITVTLLAPTADFTASPVSGTEPLAVQFTDASTGTITSYSWDFGDGATSALQDPSHTYSSAGTYSVNLTVIGPGGSDSEVKAGYITANSPPSRQTGSSGGSSTPPAFVGASSRLKAGVETTLRYQKDSTVRSIEFVPVNDLPNVMVVTTEGVPLPKDLPGPSGTVLGTFDVTLYHAQAGDLGMVTFSFRIPASRLIGTGLGHGDVVLMRGGVTSWEALPTEYLGESDGFLLYRATSPGLSTFAIMGVPGRAANLTAKPETMPEVTSATAVPTTMATIQTTHSTLPVTTTTVPEATPARVIPLSPAPILICLAVTVLLRRIRQ